MIDTPSSYVPIRVPHIFSRLDSKTKSQYIAKYKTMKKVSVSTSIGVATLTGVVAIAKHIMFSKLKAYGYRILFGLLLGPIVQLISLPFYIYSYGMYFKKYAIAIMQIGAQITKGEFELIGLAWIISDFVLFGEFIPLTDDMNFCIAHNETGSAIQDAFIYAMEDTGGI